MFEELKKYKTSSYFLFKIEDSLKEVCNAPTDKSGIYIIYALAKNKKELIYIGISGQKQKDGSLKTRKAGLGGIKDRIVNGHHFGKISRKKSWPWQMKKESIEALEIHWYVTHEENIKDFPRDVEELLLKTHHKTTGHLPKWNKEF